MSLFSVIAAVAALQAAAPDVSAPEIPVLDGAQAAPDCGGRADLAGAVCVTAPLGRMEAMIRSYVSGLREQHGWLEADGRDNRLVFIRRRPGGGCEGLHMLAFRDQRQAPSPQAPGYLAFSTIPGDLCAAATAPSTSSSSSQTRPDPQTP